jgi:hypothetical protein
MTMNELRALSFVVAVIATIAQLVSISFFNSIPNTKPLPDPWAIGMLVGMFALLASFMLAAVIIIDIFTQDTAPCTDIALIPAEAASSTLTIEEADDLIGTILPGLTPQQRNLVNMTLKSVVNEGMPLTTEAILDTLSTAIPEIPSEHLHVIRMALTTLPNSRDAPEFGLPPIVTDPTGYAKRFSERRKIPTPQDEPPKPVGRKPQLRRDAGPLLGIVDGVDNDNA